MSLPANVDNDNTPPGMEPILIAAAVVYTVVLLICVVLMAAS